MLIIKKLLKILSSAFFFANLVSFSHAEEVIIKNSNLTLDRATTSIYKFDSSSSSAATTSVSSELPHYLKFVDFTESKIMLEDKSVEKSKKYLCNIETETNCLETSSSTLNDLSSFGFNSYKLNSEYNFGIGFKKIDTYSELSNATTSTYEMYTLEKNKNIFLATTTDVFLEKKPTKISLSNNKIVTFIYEDMRLVSYDLNTNKKINESNILESKLDSKDYFSSITSYHISGNGKYLAWYIPATMSRFYITYGFTEINTGKSLTYKEDVKWDLVSESNNIFAFSEDESNVYFISQKSKYPNVWTANLDKSFAESKIKTQKLFERDYYVDNILINGNDLFFVANRDNKKIFSLYKYNLKDEKLKKLSEFPVSYVESMRLYNNKIFYPYMLEDKGGSIAYYDINLDKNIYFDINLDNLSKIDISKYNYLNKSDTKIILGIPDTVSSTTNTLTVFLHGGPYRQMNLGYHPFGSYGSFDWVLEGARKNGSYVAKLEYPGSFGYGISYTQSLMGNIGDKELNSILLDINKIKTKYKNIKKVNLVGISYGGYLALKAYTENPSEFENVFSFAPVSDWESQNEKDPYLLFNLHFNKNETSLTLTSSSTEKKMDPKLRELYDMASIYDKIGTLPKENNLYLYHGNLDKNVQYKQSLQFDNLMVKNNKNYTFTTFDKQPHVYNKRNVWEKVCSDILSKLNGSIKNYCTLEK